MIFCLSWISDSRSFSIVCNTSNTSLLSYISEFFFLIGHWIQTNRTSNSRVNLRFAQLDQPKLLVHWTVHRWGKCKNQSRGLFSQTGQVFTHLILLDTPCGPPAKLAGLPGYIPNLYPKIWFRSLDLVSRNAIRRSFICSTVCLKSDNIKIISFDFILVFTD